MTTIIVILALAIAWYAVWFSVPPSKRGIASAICAMLFGCTMIVIALNQLNS